MRPSFALAATEKRGMTMQTRKGELIAAAERNLQQAKAEGGHSPCEDALIDALENLIEAMKITTDSYVVTDARSKV